MIISYEHLHATMNVISNGTLQYKDERDNILNIPQHKGCDDATIQIIVTNYVRLCPRV